MTQGNGHVEASFLVCHCLKFSLSHFMNLPELFLNVFLNFLNFINTTQKSFRGRHGGKLEFMRRFRTNVDLRG